MEKYGDIQGVKTLLQIHEEEYDNLKNDNLLIDCLLLANTDLKSYLYYNCIDLHTDCCDRFYLDNIVNLLSLGYIFLSTNSQVTDINLGDKHKVFTDKAYFLLDQLRNKLRSDEGDCRVENRNVGLIKGAPIISPCDRRHCHNHGNSEQRRGLSGRLC